MRGMGIVLVAALLVGCRAEDQPWADAPDTAGAPDEPAPLASLADEPTSPAARHDGAEPAPAARAEPAPEPKGQEFACTGGLRRTWHQSPDGAWRCRTFTHECRQEGCDGAGATDDHTDALTGLMLLAFLGAGHSPRHGRYKTEVTRGLEYLCAQQGNSGRIGRPTGGGVAAYNHALATWALCETVARVRQPEVPESRFAAPAQAAVQHLIATQSPVGVWANALDPRWGDAALTVWNWVALLGARRAGLDVPDAAFDAADRWFDWATDPDTGEVGWRRRGDTGARPAGVGWMTSTRALTAGVTACRVLRGETTGSARVRRVADRLRAAPPSWEPAEQRDFLYWLFGTWVMFRMGGEDWRVWSAGLKDALVNTQRRGGCPDGTWDPLDPWGGQGGRLYATGAAVLALEVYYRYGHVLGGPEPKRE